MAKPITTLLFDFDGTLLDTNELIVASFQHVLDTHFPGKYSRIDILPFLGPTLLSTFSSIDPEQAPRLVAEYREWNGAMHDKMAKEFDRVSETMRLLKAAGMKMAIVSTKKRDMVMRGIGLLDVEGVFDVVIGLDDVKNPKPNPEPIELALEKLGATKEEVLMIGDNSHDINGGKNAGVRTAGVAWSVKGEQFMQSLKPDYILHHITDLFDIIKGLES